MPTARELEMVVSSLSPVVGARTVWLDPYGRLWHTSPRQNAPHCQWRAIGTFVRPSIEAVAAAVAAVLAPVRAGV